MVFCQKAWLPWETSQTERLSLCERTAKDKLRVRQTLEQMSGGGQMCWNMIRQDILSFQTLTRVTSSTSAQPDTAAKNTIYRTKPKRVCVCVCVCVCLLFCCQAEQTKQLKRSADANNKHTADGQRCTLLRNEFLRKKKIFEAKKP